MYKTILMPIDLAHTERTAAMLKSINVAASSSDTRIILLHVIPDLPLYVSTQIPAELLKKAAIEAREQLENLARQHGLNDTAALSVQHGKPSRTILDTAEKEGADLIIIGSHEMHPSDYLLGSVASKVVRHAKCSVLVVR